MLYKKLLPAFIATTLLVAAMPGPAAAARLALPDVTGHWAESEIRDAALAGWINGYPDGTFQPEATVTRAEFIKMVAGVKGAAPATTIPDPRLAAHGRWGLTRRSPAPMRRF